jgi:WD40 repeat protein
MKLSLSRRVLVIVAATGAIVIGPPLVLIWQWEHRSMRLILQLDEGRRSFGAALTHIAISPSGNTVGGVTRGGSLLIWSTERASGKPVSLSMPNEIRCVQFIPESKDRGECLVSGDTSGGLSLWDPSGTLLSELNVSGAIFRRGSDHSRDSSEAREGIVKPITAIAVSRGGTHCATAHGLTDPVVVIWDLKSLRSTQAMSGHLRVVRDMAFSPNADLLVSTSDDDSVRVWNVKSAVVEKVFGTPTPRKAVDAICPRSVAWSSDGKLIAIGYSGGWSGAIEIVSCGQWNVESRKELPRSVNALEFLADSERLLIASEKRVLEWRASAGIMSSTSAIHESEIHGLAVAARRNWLVTSSDEGVARIWRIQP